MLLGGEFYSGVLSIFSQAVTGGDITLELARRVGPEGRVVGTDIDEAKLELARAEAREHDAGFRPIPHRERR